MCYKQQFLSWITYKCWVIKREFLYYFILFMYYRTLLVYYSTLLVYYSTLCRYYCILFRYYCTVVTCYSIGFPIGSSDTFVFYFIVFTYYRTLFASYSTVFRIIPLFSVLLHCFQSTALLGQYSLHYQISNVTMCYIVARASRYLIGGHESCQRDCTLSAFNKITLSLSRQVTCICPNKEPKVLLVRSK